MRRAAPVAGFVIACLTAANAAAESPWYLEGGAGAYFRSSRTGPARFHHDTTPTVTVPGVATLKLDPGATVNFGVGYRLTPHVRLEAEAGYVSYTGDTLNPYTAAPGYPALDGRTFTRRSGDRWTQYTGTLNAFYDFAPWGGRFTPYVGGGVGFSADHRSNGLYETAARQTFTTTGGSSTLGLALLEGGVGMVLSQHWAIVPAYRYVRLFAGSPEQAHVAKVGLRYSF